MHALGPNSGTKASTLRKNLVKIDSVTSEFQKGVSEIFAATAPQFDDRRTFGTLAFRNRLEYRNFDFSRLIVNHFYTSYRNSKMARFG